MKITFECAGIEQTFLVNKKEYDACYDLLFGRNKCFYSQEGKCIYPTNDGADCDKINCELEAE